MIEFVSQHEVDALLAGTDAKAAKPKPIAWTFAPAPRVSRGRRAPLEDALRTYTRDVEGYLTSLLQTPIEFRLAGLETAPVAELLLSLDAPCAAFPLGLRAQGSASGILDFGPAIAFQLIERLLGGPGETQAPHRALSPLEQGVLQTVAAPLIDRLRVAWSGVLPFTAEPGAFESDPSALRPLFAGEEEVIVAHFELKDSEFRGVLTLGLPAGAVAMALDSRTPRTVVAGTGAGTAQASALEPGLRSARVDVAVRLPSIRISARDLSRVAVGQVIHTSQAVDSALEVHVNGRPRFNATLGRVRASIGVRILGPFEGSSARAARPREGRVV